MNTSIPTVIKTERLYIGNAYLSHHVAMKPELKSLNAYFEEPSNQWVRISYLAEIGEYYFVQFQSATYIKMNILEGPANIPLTAILS